MKTLLVAALLALASVSAVQAGCIPIDLALAKHEEMGVTNFRYLDQRGVEQANIFTNALALDRPPIQFPRAAFAEHPKFGLMLILGTQTQFCEAVLGVAESARIAIEGQGV